MSPFFIIAAKMVFLSLGRSILGEVDFATVVEDCVDCLYAGLMSSSEASTTEIVDFFDKLFGYSFWKLTEEGRSWVGGEC